MIALFRKCTACGRNNICLIRQVEFREVHQCECGADIIEVAQGARIVEPQLKGKVSVGVYVL